MKIVTTNERTVLDITYWPTDICNFSCDYCFPGSTDGVNRYPKDLEKTLELFDNIFKKYKSKGKTKFNISVAGGGEPTLWPELGEFCEQIKTMADVSLQITSNASRTLRWWEQYKHTFNSCALSLHHKEANIEHFIKVADMLYEAGCDVTAQVLMDPQYWNKCVDLLEKLFKSKYKWFIQAKDVIGHGSYNEEQLEFLKNSYKRLAPSERLIQNIDNYNLIKSVQIDDNDNITISKVNTYIVNSKNKFLNWRCNFPLERIAVDSAGRIKGSCGLEFDLETLEPVTCTRLTCDCPPDTHVTKWTV